NRSPLKACTKTLGADVMDAFAEHSRGHLITDRLGRHLEADGHLADGEIFFCRGNRSARGGWLVHGGQQKAQGIPAGRRVLMGSGEGSGIAGGVQYTGSLSVCSGCRCWLQGQGGSGGRGPRG